MRDCTQHIGLLWVDLFIPAAGSLKEKRMVLKSIQGRIQSRFNVSVAQLDTDDKWQTAAIGVVMIANDNRFVDQCLQNVLSFIESFGTVEISDHQISFI